MLTPDQPAGMPIYDGQRPDALQTFLNRNEGHRWIMSRLGGLDSAGNVLANPFTEAEIVRMARKSITDETERAVLGQALTAMGWTADRLAKLESP